MAHITVKVNEFEGPFDLLFHLIEKNEMDIYNIPIALLTDQYMDYINTFAQKDMDNMSEFLLMAATLLEIKSKMLLPRRKDKEEQEQDPRSELIEMLVEYKRYKAVTEAFKNKESNSRLVFYKEQEKTLMALFKPETNVDIDELLGGITLDKLYAVFDDVLRRRDLTTDKIRSGFGAIKKDLYTVEEKMDYINDLLKLHGRIVFSKIFRMHAGKEEMIVTFWALLELIKIKRIAIRQDNNFDEILIGKYGEPMTLQT